MLNYVAKIKVCVLFYHESANHYRKNAAQIDVVVDEYCERQLFSLSPYQLFFERRHSRGDMLMVAD